MNGIDKITGRIAADARAEADRILAEARSQAEELVSAAKAESDKECAAIAARGERTAQARAERLASMAQLEGRKRLLAARQESIGLAFDRALEKLLHLPEEEYVELLAGMAARACATGREKVILSAKDHKRLGKAMVARANELLAKKGSPKLPEELTSSAAGAILDKVVSAGSALLTGTAQLALSAETRDIPGGFILEAEGVEVNCAFDTLVRLSRPELERQVAQILFGT